MKPKLVYYQGRQVKLYGPYLNHEPRYFVILLDPKTEDRKSLIYARYVMEQHLHRPLEEDEIIWHIDGNQLNDDLPNLEVISEKESHRRIALALYGEPVAELVCENCGKTFYRVASVERMRQKLTPGKGIFCSHKCVGVSQRNERTLARSLNVRT